MTSAFEDGGFVLIGTHVDDIFPLFNEKGRKIRDRILNGLKSKMEIDDKGEISFALDTRVQRNKKRRHTQTKPNGLHRKFTKRV